MKKKLFLIFLILCNLPLFSEIRYKDKKEIDEYNETQKYFRMPVYRLLWCECDTEEELNQILNLKDIEQYKCKDNIITDDTKSTRTYYYIIAEYNTYTEFIEIYISYYEKDKTSVYLYTYMIPPEWMRSKQ